MTAGDPMHPSEDELHAFADGTLAPAPRAALTRHAAECADCAAVVERVRALLSTVSAAPRAIDPPFDLWPSIEGRIGALRRTASAPPRGWRSTLWLAAAAAALVVLSSAVTWEISQRRTRATSVVAGERSPTVDSSPAVMTVSDYDHLDRELASLLAAHRKTLRPETIATVERNLAIIDQAIAEIRSALAEDPLNRVLHDLLRSSYGQKAALLRQVSQT